MLHFYLLDYIIHLLKMLTLLLPSSFIYISLCSKGQAIKNRSINSNQRQYMEDSLNILGDKA